MPWWMIITLLVYTLASFFLIFVILIQSGKGEGLSSLGSATQGLSDTLGATGAEKMFNKMTTGSAILFMVLAIVLSIGGKKMSSEQENILGEEPTAPAAQTITETQKKDEIPAGQLPAAPPAAPAKAVPVAPAPAPAAPASK